MSADDDALLARRVDKIVAITDPETVEPTQAALVACDFEGHEPRECGEHRTVGPHRAWCFDCGEWCYPEAPCVRCEVATLRKQAETRETDDRCTDPACLAGTWAAGLTHVHPPSTGEQRATGPIQPADGA